MASPRPAEQQHIDKLIEILSIEYEGRADGQQVGEVVQDTFERLVRESAVKDFVPILTERRARVRLTERWGGRRAAGATPERLVDRQDA